MLSEHCYVRQESLEHSHTASQFQTMETVMHTNTIVKESTPSTWWTQLQFHIRTQSSAFCKNLRFFTCRILFDTTRYPAIAVHTFVHWGPLTWTCMLSTCSYWVSRKDRWSQDSPSLILPGPSTFLWNPKGDPRCLIPVSRCSLQKTDIVWQP